MPQPETNDSTKTEPASPEGDSRGTRPRPTRSTNLVDAAREGSIWTTAQTIVNKLATAAAMYVAVHQLSAEEVGLGSLVGAIASAVIVLPPLVTGDVLLAHLAHRQAVFPHVQRLALMAGVLMALTLIVAAPTVTLLYPEYSPNILMALVALYAIRPLANSITGPNLALLRSELRYRTIVKIDGSTQLLGSTLMIVLALSGAGAFTLVLPQLVLSVVRATCRLLRARLVRQRDLEAAAALSEGAPQAARAVRRDFVLAALAQYVHTFVSSIAVVLLGYFSNEREVGLYGFALMLASQVTLLFSYQIGAVMQPIFGRMNTDPVRQAHSYRALLRGLASVAVPIALIQAAMAEPVFVLFFDERWLPALEVFQVVSITQCFTFALAPTLSMIKSQRRFRAYFVWQIAHIAVAACALSLFAAPRGAVATALAELAVWAVSIFLAKRVAVRALQPTLAGSLRSFLAPWTTALPMALLAWLATNQLMQFGTWGAVAALALVAPAALAGAFALMRLSDEQSFLFIATRTPIAPVLRRIGVNVRD